MATPSVTPPPLPVYAQSVEDIEGRWWVVESRSHHEKRIAGYMAERGISYCLPWEAVIKYVGRDRERRSQDRLVFPGYVFACCRDDRERYDIEDAPQLHEHLLRRPLMNVPNQDRLVRDLLFVNDLLGTGRILWDYEPQAGDEVVVAHGPWMNFTGKVAEPLIRRARDGVLYAAVEIETLGRKLCCEIPRDFLERAA